MVPIRFSSWSTGLKQTKSNQLSTAFLKNRKLQTKIQMWPHSGRNSDIKCKICNKDSTIEGIGPEVKVSPGEVSATDHQVKDQTLQETVNFVSTAKL
jgi:hypothetical protein